MERSEVKFGNDEIDVIIHPNKCFSRNMEYGHLAFGREVQIGYINLLLNSDHFYMCKSKVIRTENISPIGIVVRLAISIVLGAGGKEVKKSGIILTYSRTSEAH